MLSSVLLHALDSCADQDENRDGAPAVTVIVPTRNESGNIPALVERLTAALRRERAEILFVDDSDDDTPMRIRRQAARSRLPVRLLAREPGERTGGLAGAVVAGMRATTAEYVVVMDGDLQHPPEVVPKLLAEARRRRLDIVVGSRHADGGDSDGLAGASRVAVSNSATFLTKLSFPRRISGISDPMSGLFAVRRAALSLADFRPVGFKILLEILVRTPGLTRGEVGFEFAERTSGESKATIREGLRFARHLGRLHIARMSALLLSPAVRRAVLFGLVGASGIAVNSLALWLFSDRGTLALPYVAGAVLATQASTLWNFVLNERLVFAATPGQDRGRAGLLRRYLQFLALNSAALLLRIPLLLVLVEWLRVPYLIANALTLFAIFAGRFAVADRLIYSRGGMHVDRHSLGVNLGSARRTEEQPAA